MWLNTRCYLPALSLFLSVVSCSNQVQVREDKPVVKVVEETKPQLGYKETSGEELTNEEILSTIFSPEKFGPLQECIKNEIIRNHELSREILVDFSITNEGVIGEVNMDDARQQDGELHECLKEKLQAIQFRSYSGEVKNISIPFRW
jgi:hypothetical protein